MGDLTIRCSNCEGLVKEIDSSRPFFTCKFCGAQNKNPIYESRKQQQQRRQAEVMAQTDAAMAQSQQLWRKYRWWWIGLPVALMLGGSVMSMVLMSSQQRRARRATATARRASTPPKAKPILWLWIDSRHPFPLQADRDGVEDVALLVREEMRLRGVVKRTSVLLAVYSGKTFAPLWKVAANKKDRLWRAPGKLIITRAEQLLVYRDTDGKLLWRAKLADKIERLGLVESQLRVGIATKAWLGFDSASGKAQGEVKEPQLDLRCDWHYFQRSRDDSRGDIRRPYRQFKGYTVHAVFCPPTRRTRFRRDGRKLAWNARGKFCRTPHGLAEVGPSKGTRVPYLLGYERKTKKQRWIRRLTPKLEIFQTYPKVAFHDAEALATYKVQKAPRVIELFNLVDGKVRWTLKTTAGLPRTGRSKEKRWDNEPRGLALGQRAYVMHGGYTGLQLLDRATGKELGWIRGDKR
jgi:hypothetical protein